MSKTTIGKKAPDFKLQGTAGDWTLKGAAGGNVVMYFYPRDNTPGCTQEGADFAAAFARFKKTGTRSSAFRRTAWKRTRNSRPRWASPSNC